MSRDQINIRCGREMKRYLEDLDIDYSKYVRELIDEDRIKKCNPDFIKNVIKQKKEEIKQLESLLSSPHPMMQKAMEVMGRYAKKFKEQAPNRTQEQNHKFIENVVLPDIKKLGINKSVEEIESVLINFPVTDGEVD